MATRPTTRQSRRRATARPADQAPTPSDPLARLITDAQTRASGAVKEWLGAMLRGENHTKVIDKKGTN